MLARLRHGFNFLLDPMGFVGGRFARWGDVYFVDAEGQPGLFVLRHPDHIEQVLVTDSKSYRKQHSAFAHLSQVLGDGLLTTDGEVWRRQRRLLQPAFSRKRLDEYADAMATEADREVASWRDGEERDVAKAMMEMTLRIVCRTLFGHDASEDIDAVARSMHEFQESLLGVRLPVPQVLSPARRRMLRASQTLDSVIYPLIDARRRDRPARGDLLTRLLEATDEDGTGLSEREIRDQLVTLFLAGHETTANALSWAFHLLSGEPEVEAKLHAELDRVLGGRPPRASDLPELVYTDQVFSEAMRLFPPVYVIARKAVRDTTIGRWAVPAGSEVVMWAWHTHRDPRWWDEPWAFRPERFDKEHARKRPRLAYLPFGAGPRACIGKVFAQMEGTLALAAVASRWTLRSTAMPELQPRITLSPKGGLPMRVVRREHP